MHGHPYPTLADRPIAPAMKDADSNCWLDDSPDPDDDPGCSEQLRVTDVDSDDSTEGSPLRLQCPDADRNLDARTASNHAETQHQHSMHNAHPPGGRDAPASSIPYDRPTPQKGGASDLTQARCASHHKSFAFRNRLPTPRFGKEDLLSLFSQAGAQRSGEQSSAGRASAEEQRLPFAFTLPPLSWIKPCRSRSDDSAHEDKDKSLNQKGSSSETERTTKELDEELQPSSTKQHRLHLNFKDDQLEAQFCQWSAKQHTKVTFKSCPRTGRCIITILAPQHQRCCRSYALSCSPACFCIQHTSGANPSVTCITCTWMRAVKKPQVRCDSCQHTQLYVTTAV